MHRSTLFLTFLTIFVVQLGLSSYNFTYAQSSDSNKNLVDFLFGSHVELEPDLAGGIVLSNTGEHYRAIQKNNIIYARSLDDPEPESRSEVFLNDNFELPATPLTPRDRAAQFLISGQKHLHIGELDSAKHALKQSFEIYSQENQPFRQTAALQFGGVIHLLNRNYEDAQLLFASTLNSNRNLDQTFVPSGTTVRNLVLAITIDINGQAIAYAETGRVSEADQMFRLVMDFCRHTFQPRCKNMGFSGIARLAKLRGDTVVTSSFLKKSLRWYLSGSKVKSDVSEFVKNGLRAASSGDFRLACSSFTAASEQQEPPIDEFAIGFELQFARDIACN